jgi:AraC-like DNA-binding protein
MYHWKQNKGILFFIFLFLIINCRELLYLFLQEKSHEVYLAIFYIHSLPLAYLVGPALYFYIQSFVVGKFEFHPKQLIHVIPAVVCLISIYPYLTISMDEKIEYFRTISFNVLNLRFFDNATLFLPLKYLQIGVSFLNYGYCGVTIFYLFKEYLNDRKKNKNSVFTIIKLTILIFVFIGIPVGLIILNILSQSELNDSLVISYHLIQSIKIPTLLTLFLPFCLLLFPSWMYLNKSNSLQIFNHSNAFSSSNQKNSDSEKYIYLNEGEMLIEYLHEKKPYLNIDFSLHQIAKDLDIPQAKVIDIFKSNLKMSFPKYRNKLRVDYAIELIKNNDHLITTLHGISQKAGFRNKATFYSAFKEFMNCTPTEWIEKNNQQLDEKDI